MPLISAPDPEFLTQIASMEEGSKAADEATMLQGQRKWMYPPLNGWSGDPHDITGMNQAFTRAHLNHVYKQLIRSTTLSGTTGEVMAVKLQIDYIAALERAFRTRYCSSVRARIHAAGRRRGQGTTEGVFTNSVTLWLERLLFAAHDDPYEGVAPGEEPND